MRQHIGDAWPLGAVRLASVLCVLALEYVALFLALAWAFDGADIARLPAVWRQAVWGATGALGVVILGVCAAVVFWRDALRQEAARLDPPGAWSIPWLAVHGASFLVLGFSLGFSLSRPAVAEEQGAVPLALWLAAGAGTLLALVRAAFGSGLPRLRRGLVTAVAGAAGLGALMALLLAQVTASWTVLADPTLRLSARLLHLVSDEVAVFPGERLIAIGDFVVLVDAACSGIEGIVLVGLFVGGYLVRFRAAYRYPLVLLVVPAAMALSFLANGLRIAVLVLIGAYVNPELAKGAFHSMAGWIFFCCLTIGMIALCERTPWLHSRARPPAAGERAREIAGETAGGTSNPAAVFLLPFLVWLALGMLASAMTLGLDALYPLRVGVVAALLAALPRPASSGASSRVPAPAGRDRLGALAAVLIGAVVFLVWLALSPPPGPPRTLASVVAETGWPGGFLLFWLACRLVGAILIVPVIEERAFRGFLQRRLVSADFTAVGYRTWRWLPVLGSATAFGLLHGNWAAGILAGIAFSAAAALRGRLGDAILAHATANLLIAIAVLGFGRWDLW